MTLYSEDPNLKEQQSEQVARLLFTKIKGHEDMTFKDYLEQLTNGIKREYPVQKKAAVFVIRKAEERILEGQEVMKLMKEAIIIPDRKGIAYHIVSMKWWQKWLKYTQQTSANLIENFESDN